MKYLLTNVNANKSVEVGRDSSVRAILNTIGDGGMNEQGVARTMMSLRKLGEGETVTLNDHWQISRVES